MNSDLAGPCTDISTDIPHLSALATRNYGFAGARGGCWIRKHPRMASGGAFHALGTVANPPKPTEELGVWRRSPDLSRGIRVHAPAEHRFGHFSRGCEPVTPLQARIVADFRRHVGDRLLREGAGMAAYRLVCGGEEATFETFRSAMLDLQAEALKYGASILAEPARSDFLDEAIPRALLFWIGDWGRKLNDPGVWDRYVHDIAVSAGVRCPEGPWKMIAAIDPDVPPDDGQ